MILSQAAIRIKKIKKQPEQKNKYHKKIVQIHRTKENQKIKMLMMHYLMLQILEIQEKTVKKVSYKLKALQINWFQLLLVSKHIQTMKKVLKFRRKNKFTKIRDNCLFFQMKYNKTKQVSCNQIKNKLN
ncbi:hypothetical protein TTHERM_000307831 (macronuclear) [Tetrahymena thermophila SB210]|uniref:Uncharacterized protein n=1 Tax=Tetrahymena thermophila (strain SB210) TaxID=312017 RepID=W7X6Z0_TETTS|nr:hypothetical protein TTHERM_000307831 [Tetrahymena thermophila SB210]EWS73132.1 hypothetical protein TTHERM_000307831 [Tetrahymena thermophila SB210]|eukprot:XP_012654319.1 hypothetical protein TTHERM_000307831 [Tetrahymena thermophila SB210]